MKALVLLLLLTSCAKTIYRLRTQSYNKEQTSPPPIEYTLDQQKLVPKNKEGLGYEINKDKKHSDLLNVRLVTEAQMSIDEAKWYMCMLSHQYCDKSNKIPYKDPIKVTKERIGGKDFTVAETQLACRKNAYTLVLREVEEVGPEKVSEFMKDNKGGLKIKNVFFDPKEIIRIGDILVSINGKRVETLLDVERVIDDIKELDVTLGIIRDYKLIQVTQTVFDGSNLLKKTKRCEFN